MYVYRIHIYVDIRIYIYIYIYIYKHICINIHIYEPWGLQGPPTFIRGPRQSTSSVTLMNHTSTSTNQQIEKRPQIITPRVDIFTTNIVNFQRCRPIRVSCLLSLVRSSRELSEGIVHEPSEHSQWCTCCERSERDLLALEACQETEGNRERESDKNVGYTYVQVGNRYVSLRAKREQLEKSKFLLPSSQAHCLATMVSYVPYSLDSGRTWGFKARNRPWSTTTGYFLSSDRGAYTTVKARTFQVDVHKTVKGVASSLGRGSTSSYVCPRQPQLGTSSQRMWHM